MKTKERQITQMFQSCQEERWDNQRVLVWDLINHNQYIDEL